MSRMAPDAWVVPSPQRAEKTAERKLVAEWWAVRFADGWYCGFRRPHVGRSLRHLYEQAIAHTIAWRDGGKVVRVRTYEVTR